MSSQTLATEQLLELLMQLKKTTPAAAKQILNGQPSISYALITLMVAMNAIKLDVFYKVLAEYGNGSAAQLPLAQLPAPAVPPHLQPHPPYRNATPPAAVPPPPVYPNGSGTPQPYPYSQPSQPMTGAASSYAGYTQSGYPQYPPYGAQPHAPAPTNASPGLPDALANIPEDQKAIIMRVLSMTPEQINMLPPAERATYIQLRATLGVPTG